MPLVRELADLAHLTTTADPAELEYLTAQLEAARIPYVIQAGTALPVLDGNRLLDDLGEPWQARLWVVDRRAKEARAILAAASAGGSSPDTETEPLPLVESDELAEPDELVEPDEIIEPR